MIPILRKCKWFHVILGSVPIGFSGPHYYAYEARLTDGYPFFRPFKGWSSNRKLSCKKIPKWLYGAPLRKIWIKFNETTKKNLQWSSSFLKFFEKLWQVLTQTHTYFFLFWSIVETVILTKYSSYSINYKYWKLANNTRHIF